MDLNQQNEQSRKGRCMARPFTCSILKHSGKKEQYARIEALVLEVQHMFCEQLSALEEHQFIVDRWERPDNNGGGIACIVQNGKTFDKAGCNVSVFTGSLSQVASDHLRQRHPHLKQCQFDCFVAGVSAAIHHSNPFVPFFHFNIRYFEVTDNEGNTVWWFGGCCDLAPYYIFDEEITQYHRSLKEFCDKFNTSFYSKYKTWCDDYFFIHHRGERRGVGGIYFDDLNDMPFEKCFEFVSSFGNILLPLYIAFHQKHSSDKYTEKEKTWQLYLRGRNVEFILLYDRGIQFGLKMPDQRVESILMTLPLEARFEFNFQVKQGTEEHRALEAWKTRRDWL